MKSEERRGRVKRGEEEWRISTTKSPHPTHIPYRTPSQVPFENYESFQVLRYEIGQKYNAHHDYGESLTVPSSVSVIVAYVLVAFQTCIDGFPEVAHRLLRSGLQK